MKKTKVINLLGGPGLGKSVLRADIFSYLKKHGIDCEEVNEYAKEKVWEEAFKTLDDQIYVFSKQHRKQFRLIDKVNAVVTDSPLLLSILYNKGKDSQASALNSLVVESINTYDNLNLFLKRTTEYNPNGRMQTKKEAEALDIEVRNLLESNSMSYVEVDINRPEEILNLVMKFVLEV